jgi:ribosomal RNA-processing protein 17
MGFLRGVKPKLSDTGSDKTVPRKAINKKTKTKIVFDENARKDFLTGFRKRKDERRKAWKEKIDKQLKNEIKKMKHQTREKLEKGGMSKKNSSHQIVPEVAHLINSDLARTTVTEINGASVSVTSIDSLKPWHDTARSDSSEDEEEDDDAEEEVPGMSMKKKKTEEVVAVQIGAREKKAICKVAVAELHKSKAFKAKEAVKAKKQRNAARWKKGKKATKRKNHAKKFQNPNSK